MTTILDSYQVLAPENLRDDLSAAVDFVSTEIFIARIYDNTAVEIIASPEVLPILAEAAAAFDGDELPAGFRLREG
ncbi:hypothetical protein [Corynebacterium alimapuense]|nr:hypothetical protein [Corynebacterium alimapuense]